jgi:hypothetical protein
VSGLAVTAATGETLLSCSWDGTIKKTTPDGVTTDTIVMDEVLTAIATDLSGNIYVASTENVVHKLDSLGELIWTYTGHTGNVNDIDVDASGNVYTASVDNTIHKLTSAGTLIWSYESTELFNFNTVAVDQTGAVIGATQNGRVVKLSTAGAEVWEFDGFTGPVTAVAIDDSNSVYATGYDDNVVKLDSSGTEVWDYILTDSGHSLSLDNLGFIYVGLDNGYVVKLQANNGALNWINTFSLTRVAAIATFPVVGAFHSIW